MKVRSTKQNGIAFWREATEAEIDAYNRQKRVIIMREHLDMKFKDIADHFGVSVQRARQLYLKGKSHNERWSA